MLPHNSPEQPNLSFVTKIGAAWPLARWRNVTVLVAVSGGADSVALVRALTQLHGEGTGRLVVAHFNHRLRGTESDGDQDFVENLGQALSLEVIVGQADSSNQTTRGGHAGQSLEGAAREARYQFLKAAAHECGARYIATAHTSDDQVETVLHHILRGTGLAGLAGISSTRRLTEAATLVRPMLNVTRAEVIGYLHSLQQPFREDATNRDEHFTRNRIRHSLLPQLEREYNPRARDAIARLAQIAAQADDFLSQEARQLLEKAGSATSDGITLDAALLNAAHPAVVRQCFLVLWRQQGWPQQAMSLEKWSELVDLVQSTLAGDEWPAQIYPGGIRVEKIGPHMRLSRVA